MMCSNWHLVRARTRERRRAGELQLRCDVNVLENADGTLPPSEGCGRRRSVPMPARSAEIRWRAQRPGEPTSPNDCLDAPHVPPNFTITTWLACSPRRVMRTSAPSAKMNSRLNDPIRTIRRQFSCQTWFLSISVLPVTAQYLRPTPHRNVRLGGSFGVNVEASAPEASPSTWTPRRRRPRKSRPGRNIVARRSFPRKPREKMVAIASCVVRLWGCCFCARAHLRPVYLLHVLRRNHSSTGGDRRASTATLPGARRSRASTTRRRSPRTHWIHHRRGSGYSRRSLLAQNLLRIAAQLIDRGLRPSTCAGRLSTAHCG